MAQKLISQCLAKRFLRMPDYVNGRLSQPSLLFQKSKFIKVEDLREYQLCFNEELEYHDKQHDEEISRKNAEIETLKQQIFNRDPKNLAKHIQSGPG